MQTLNVKENFLYNITAFLVYQLQTDVFVAGEVSECESGRYLKRRILVEIQPV
jgi:hypothetical protein